MTGRTAIGIILRLRQLGESDLLVDLYTGRMGRITAIAKGARRSQKRFFGLLLVGHLIEGQLAKSKSGDLWRLDGAKVIENYALIRDDWYRWVFAAPVLELLLRMTAPHDPSEGLLHLADEALKRLCRADQKRIMASDILIFMVNLADKLGFGLSFDVCVVCGRPAAPQSTLHLSHQGGVVCRHCGNHDCMAVPQGLVKGMSAALQMPPEQRARLVFPIAICRQGIEFMTNYLQAICGRDIQSLGVLLPLLAK